MRKQDVRKPRITHLLGAQTPLDEHKGAVETRMHTNRPLPGQTLVENRVELQEEETCTI